MSSPLVPELASSVDAVLSGEPFAEDSLLPGPAALLDRLDGALAVADERPADRAVIRPLRPGDRWSTSPAVLATVTALLAGGLRADDWLAREGTAEFAVLVDGDVDATEAAVRRMVGAVGGVITGIAAAAGVVALERGLDAVEIRRRALLCLAAARTQGSGVLIRSRGTR